MEPSAEALAERLVGSTVVHRGRYLRVEVQTFERADGSRSERDIVVHPGAVAIVAVDSQGRLVMVRQWRVAAGQDLLEIPAGTLDRDSDGALEDPALAASRELEEETGYRAASWRLVARFWTAPGFATELMHLYFATDLSPVDERRTPEEDERLVVEHVPLDDALAMIDDGRIADAKSIVGLLWLSREGTAPDA